MKTKRQQILTILSKTMNKMDMYVIGLMSDEQLSVYYEKMSKTVNV